MKITKVEAIYLRQPQVRELCDSGQDALVVRVETDAGITGIGEVDSNPLAAKGAIEGPMSHTTATGLAQVVVGEDPFETERLWYRMYRANIYGGRRGVGLHAMSGIDLALWDINWRFGTSRGKRWDCPSGSCSAAASSGRFAAMPARCSAPLPRKRASWRGAIASRGSRRSSSAGTRWGRMRRPTSRWCARRAKAWETTPTC